MSRVSFDITRADSALVVRIVQRAVAQGICPNTTEAVQSLQMDLTAVHANDCALDFQKFLDFDDFNFRHDLFGIQGHIDRTTGKLTGFFVPRCAKPEVEA